MSGFFNKLRTLVVGSANDAIDAATPVGTAARQDIRDIEAQLARAEEALNSAKAEKILLANKAGEARKQAAHWADNARAAVTASNDDLARQCLAKKKDAETEAAQYEAQLAPFEANVTQLEARIDELRHHRDEMERNADMLIARSEVARATKGVADAMGAIDGKGAAQDFDRLGDKVSRQEASAQAAMETASHRNGGDLEAQVAALGAKSGVEDDLAALKAEMGQ